MQQQPNPTVPFKVSEPLDKQIGEIYVAQGDILKLRNCERVGRERLRIRIPACSSHKRRMKKLRLLSDRPFHNFY